MDEYGRLLIIGVGALGSAFISRTREKFSAVGIFDGDIITGENFKTQPFYSKCNLDLPVSKAVFTADEMRREHKNTEYTAYNRYFTEDDIDIVKEYDIILDFTDNIKSRLVVNRAATKYEKPAMFASINESELSLFFYSKGSACFNCILRNSSGRAKEGCEAVIPALSDKAVAFMNEKLEEFLSGSLAGEFHVLGLENGGEINVKIKRDEKCEECETHSLKIGDKGFIQVCSSGIKFSSHTSISLAELENRINGSSIIGDYLIKKEGRKSLLISSNGDFLFTGYSQEEARKLLSHLFF